MAKETKERGSQKCPKRVRLPTALWAEKPGRPEYLVSNESYERKESISNLRILRLL